MQLKQAEWMAKNNMTHLQTTTDVNIEKERSKCSASYRKTQRSLHIRHNARKEEEKKKKHKEKKSESYALQLYNVALLETLLTNLVIFLIIRDTTDKSCDFLESLPHPWQKNGWW